MNIFKSSDSKKESRLSNVMGFFGRGKKDKVSSNDKKEAYQKVMRNDKEEK